MDLALSVTGDHSLSATGDQPGAMPFYYREVPALLEQRDPESTPVVLRLYELGRS